MRCPECGAEMVLKTDDISGNQTWDCPACDYAECVVDEWEVSKTLAEGAPSVPKAEMDLLVRVVLSTAIEWWDYHCPLSMSRDDHLNNRVVNCSGPKERNLATAVARFLEAGGKP